jgi:N-glycosylase/DNA lyase
MSRRTSRKTFAVEDYDLAATLNSGQAFRWEKADDGWAAVVDGRWVLLNQTRRGIEARVAEPVQDWRWLENYLQVDVDIDAVTESFPDDESMREAVKACRGLRLLLQDPWECLASFILSSNKQITQIRQMVALICERFGEEVVGDEGIGTAHAFPCAEELAALSEKDLRDCRLGYRAPYLLNSARMVAEGEVDLTRMRTMGCDKAREELLKLPGVGRKIADCALLFGGGYQEAFPIDVWILKALKELYFAGKRKVTPKRLQAFSATYFGPNGGYAQQYLFHYMRKRAGRA